MITMRVKRHQQSSAKEKTIKYENEAHFQVGHILNPVKFVWVLRLITFFNIGNNFTTNAYNILSEFPCSLTKLAMVLLVLLFSHLADAVIQSDLQIRKSN